MFCSIRLSAKAEADKVADDEANKREASGALVETILPVTGAEHPVKAGSDALTVSAQQLLPSIRGGVLVLSVEYLVAAAPCHTSGVLWSMTRIVGTVHLVWVYVIICYNI